MRGGDEGRRGRGGGEKGRRGVEEGDRNEVPVRRTYSGTYMYHVCERSGTYHVCRKL